MGCLYGGVDLDSAPLGTFHTMGGVSSGMPAGPDTDLYFPSAAFSPSSPSSLPGRCFEGSRGYLHVHETILCFKLSKLRRAVLRAIVTPDYFRYSIAGEKGLQGAASMMMRDVADFSLITSWNLEK